MTREVMRYKLNELRMMLNDGEHGEEQGILVDIIKELDKAETMGEWIPVSERLPEKNVWVLVTVEQSGKCYQEIMQIDRYKETWTDNTDYYGEAVKAWMPLPEPYKAESEVVE